LKADVRRVVVDDGESYDEDNSPYPEGIAVLQFDLKPDFFVLRQLMGFGVAGLG
jgi:hypothetical protein